MGAKKTATTSSELKISPINEKPSSQKIESIGVIKFFNSHKHTMSNAATLVMRRDPRRSQNKITSSSTTFRQQKTTLLSRKEFVAKECAVCSASADPHSPTTPLKPILAMVQTKPKSRRTLVENGMSKATMPSNHSSANFQLTNHTTDTTMLLTAHTLTTRATTPSIASTSPTRYRAELPRRLQNLQ